MFTFEILPPLKGQHIQSIFDNIDPLMEFNPPFIDVTYHREEYVYKELDDGLLKKQVVKKRPGTVGICAAIQNRYQVDAIPHILCGGFTREDTENFLIDLDYLGIQNVMALRGDPVKSETYFRPEKEGNNFASDLVSQIHDLNNGRYLDEELLNSSKTNHEVHSVGDITQISYQSKRNTFHQYYCGNDCAGSFDWIGCRHPGSVCFQWF